METLIDRKEDWISFNSEELKLLFQKINTMLARSLLNGAGLKEQENNIAMLNKISEELNRRKPVSDAAHNSEVNERS